MNGVKIQFDANQNYQLKAVDAVVNLFKGLSPEELGNNQGEFSLSQNDKETDCTANVDDLFEFDESELLDSFNEVRKDNNLQPKPYWGSTDFNDGDTLSPSFAVTEYWKYPQFTINMETGTGKTYVYLRTIYSLYQKYGFRKFVVVVPSVAIYEGAISTFNATREHFSALFEPGTVPIKMKEYDGNVTVCKDFGVSTSLEILLMTIDSFNKLSNVIFKATEKIRGGKLPISFVQDTRPILILDEVQNYKTDISLRALRTLHPLFSVGYSATPKDSTNELYQLSSFEACQMNLVKKIDVLGYSQEQIGTAEQVYFKIIDIWPDLSCDIELNAMKNGQLVPQVFNFKAHKATFFEKTRNDAYGTLTVEKVSKQAGNEYVELSDGKRYSKDQSNGTNLSKEVVFAQMIASTISQHIKKQNELLENGYDAKVLSLFFIDRVASYKSDNPIIARIFDQEFEKQKHKVEAWKNLSGKDVREGYFAQKIKAKSNEVEDIDTPIDGPRNAEERAAEKRAYELIMQGKEKLLSSSEKVCFIFAHSALREGWDNPNVFQICALREITSESNRRQTIGRGLRLPVNQNGQRIFDDKVNHLTVVANESFSQFSEKLQKEYVADGIIKMPVITNVRHKEKVSRTRRFASSEFNAIWTKANTQTEYSINIDTKELIAESIDALDHTEFEPPKLICSKGSVVITSYDLKLLKVSNDEIALFEINIKANNHPDLFGETGTKFLLKKGDIIKKKAGAVIGNCAELADLKVTEVKYDSRNPDRSSITFSKIEDPIYVGESVTHEQLNHENNSVRIDIEYPDIPKCNIIERAAKEVKLTRKTILAIFKGLKPEKIQNFLKNPEGFTSQFINVLREIVANHIARHIEYNLAGGNINNNLDMLFPKTEEYSKDELVDVNDKDKVIYDKIQVDSTVERNFVNTLDESDEKTGNVKLFFKFPPKYKINLPRIIGNYNPDWGIVRRDDGNIQLELIRETKGTEDLRMLPHSNEARKVICAQKHFRAVGLEYRVVDDTDIYWWKRETKDYVEKLYGNTSPIFRYPTPDEMIDDKYTTGGQQVAEDGNTGLYDRSGE